MVRLGAWCAGAAAAALSAVAQGREAVFGLDQVSLLKRIGYQLHEHFVVTADNYVLSLFHVQRAETSLRGAGADADDQFRPVLLQAGLMDSSKSLVNLGKHSLALQLVERGYDVWLANNRGNAWSKRHLEKDFRSTQFWEFSWDHMALDLNAEVDYVLNYTNEQSLAYVGHSQGTMQAFAALSEEAGSELATKINLFVALAPVAFLEHMSSPLLRFLARSPLPGVVAALGARDFADTPEQVRDLFPNICDAAPAGCGDLLALGFGHSHHIERADYETFVTDWPSGTSTQNLLHYVQMIKHGRFAKYDHGREGNLRVYGQAAAPEYDLAKFAQRKVPTLLVSGTEDTLADVADVERLKAIINDTVIEHVQVDGYAHMDFLWARDAAELVYPHVIRALEKIPRRAGADNVVQSYALAQTATLRGA
jgi:lysosomal acid lipase/cholesteryl ester hydrolase